MGRATPGLVVIGSIRKLAEPAMRSKIVSSSCLSQLPPPGSCPDFLNHKETKSSAPFILDPGFIVQSPELRPVTWEAGPGFKAGPQGHWLKLTRSLAESPQPQLEVVVDRTPGEVVRSKFNPMMLSIQNKCVG